MQMTPSDTRAERFTYDGYSMNPSSGEVECHYSTGEHQFTERFVFGPEGDWDAPAVAAAVRILFLLAGVSYYKTTAAHIIDCGNTSTTADERAFLGRYYRGGLGEFAYCNGIDLSGVEVVGPDGTTTVAPYTAAPGRPLIPFGGGIDSIVTVAALQDDHPEAALCIVHPNGSSFPAIEDAAARTELPIVHITRQLSPVVMRSAQLGFFNGHVPITAVITAASVVAAILGHRDAVVLSNEWSASVPTLQHEGTAINHQWSKGIAFEEDFATLVRASLGPDLSVFSYLRSRSELWVAQQFATLTEFHSVVRSCNRSFHQDPEQRLDHWCGECDKCCFIDLILAPFVSGDALRTIFSGTEPLGRSELRHRFETLLGLSPDARPFECVGDVDECRAAVYLAAARPDRQADAQLQSLRQALPMSPPADATGLLAAQGPHFIPDRYAPPDLLVSAQ
jgi:hypothetical protein